MTSVPMEAPLLLAVTLFVLGFIGVIARRNVLFILLSIEVMLNAAGLVFVAGSARWGQPDGQVMFFFVLATAAAEASVGLALVLRFHHRFKTLDVDAANRLRG
jgi:NADH-quinone oxidoreductase subunit K